MTVQRRQLLRLALLGIAAGSGYPRSALALDYPTRPVRIIVGFTAGGGSDVLARMMAQWLPERLGQPFVVENRPGAGSNLATETVARAAPDGYTLLLMNTTNAINVSLYRHLNFDLIRDIAPVAGLIRFPNVLNVTPAFPAKTVPEFITYAKANPGKIIMASGGNGGTPQVAGELFKMMAGVDMLDVPYRGSAEAMTDLISGRAQVMFNTLPESIGYIKSGQIRALAVTTTQRADAMPHLPTLNRFVPGYEASSWQGVGAPHGTPMEIISKLNAAINAALADPTMKARLSALGGTVMPGPPSDFGTLIANETKKWAKVVAFSGAKAD
jgi:tripartite-type tricarboxylate transporter receptor subunit TctC